MTTLVTGGTGFLGRFVVRELAGRGPIRVLARSFDPEIAQLDGVEFCEGDLLDEIDLARAVAGVERVYHLAGLVERDASRAHRMYELHVDGTRKLLRALPDTVEKIVVASTSGTVGVSDRPNAIAGDDAPYAEQIVRRWPYYLSKIYAERACDEIAAERGLNIVQLRPTLLLGPEDYRESSTGDVVLFLRRRIPSILEGGLSFVDVRDVATAAVSAMERAQPGEKYLLGAANMTLAEFFGHLERISGVPAPGGAIPGNLAEAGATLLGGALRWLGAEPELAPESVEMARHTWYIDWSRAERDLGFRPRAPLVTLRDTVRWIERHHPDLAVRRPAPPAEFVRAETIEWTQSDS